MLNRKDNMDPVDGAPESPKAPFSDPHDLIYKKSSQCALKICRYLYYPNPLSISQMLLSTLIKEDRKKKSHQVIVPSILFS